MVQILPVPKSFGERLAGGLNEGLEALIQDKMKKMQISKTAKGLQALGVPAEKATLIANLDPRIQQEYAKQLMLRPSQEKQMQLINQMQGIQQAPQLSDVTHPLMSTAEAQQSGITRLLPSSAQTQQTAALLQGMPQSGTQQNMQQPTSSITQPLDFSGLTPKEAIPLLNLRSQQQQRDLQEKMAREKMAHSEKMLEKKSELKQQEGFTNKTQTMIDKQTEYDNKMKKNDLVLNSMEELIKKNKEGSRAWYNIVNTLKEGLHVGGGFSLGKGGLEGGKGISVPGIDLTASLTPGAQLMDSLTMKLASGAKDVFGGRMTQLEWSNFLASIPSLRNSKEGQLALIYMNKLINKAEHIRTKTINNVAKAQNYKYNRDFWEIVENKSADQLETIKTEMFDVLNKAASTIKEANISTQPNTPASNVVDWARIHDVLPSFIR